MVRQIHIPEKLDLDEKKWLGAWPKESDYDEIVDEDCDVFGPDGELLIAFRKKTLDYSMNVTEEQQDYWRWVSKLVPTNNRGKASGREITDLVAPRITLGQMHTLRGMTRGEYETVEEVLEAANSDTALSEWCTVEKKVLEAGLIDGVKLKEISKVQRKVTREFGPHAEETQKVLREKFAIRTVWFEDWVRRFWDGAEDRVAEARRCKKVLVSSQNRGNKVHSAIVGAFDRVIRAPFGRLTKVVETDYESFVGQKDFYLEMEEKLRNLHPKGWKNLSDKFSAVKDPRFSLFGHCFTTITVNYNYRVAYHYDGNNCPDAVACLTTLDKGTYDGYEFILPQIRLGFRLRHGDIFIGDNQGMMHGMMPLKNASPDFESIWFVFYSREGVLDLESYEVECCRKDFMLHCSRNLRSTRGADKPSDWTGVFPEMWVSPEWEEYKAEHCPTAKNTNAVGS